MKTAGIVDKAKHSIRVIRQELKGTLTKGQLRQVSLPARKVSSKILISPRRKNKMKNIEPYLT